MSPQVNSFGDSDEAAKFRDAMAEKLLKDRMITSPVVETAFRTVPRHAFAPAGMSLEAVYNADESLVTKTDQYGAALSSISAPFIQAMMIEQADLRPGLRVLEIGSGGYNAALLAEVVGPEGRVVSVDIDAEVSDRARALLETTGYGDRVTVVRADAQQLLSDYGRFAAIIVTVGAWDISPAWLDQLAPIGMLVVPLRMGGVTRSIAFRREADHLVSESAEVCGFVPMQGTGKHKERVFELPDANSHHVRLRFDDAVPDDLGRLDGVLATRRTEVWSGVTIAHGTSFADLHLWNAGFLPGFCQVAAEDGTELAGERGQWFPYGCVRDDSFAYLAVRPALEGAGVEFGARAYGRHGELPATAMVEQIQAWDRHGRPAPTIGYWPNGSDDTVLPEGTAVLTKTHGRVTISWPIAG